MRLFIGLESKLYEKGWKQLLTQEGLSWEYLSKTVSPQLFSTIILGEDALFDDRVISYIESGGTVLTTNDKLGRLTDEDVDFKKTDELKYTLPYFNVEDSLCLEEVCSFLDGEAVSLRRIEKGWAIGLPFSPAKILMDDRSCCKSFSKSIHELFEMVSLINKNRIRWLFLSSLLELHARRGIPLVQKWYYPQEYSSAFSFRVDVDDFDRLDFMKTLKVFAVNKISASWFINILAIENCASMLENLKEGNQEIHSHCYEHKIFTSFEKNLENLEKARLFLKAYQATPKGVAAPFGTWNRSYNSALKKLKYDFSSEFSFAYDAFPIEVNGVWQVPVHPICIGSFINRSGSSFAENREKMLRYFDDIMKTKIENHEPIFFYGHPTGRIGLHPEVVSHIIELANQRDDVWKTTLSKYLAWWRNRAETEFTCHFDKGKLKISTSPHSSTSICLRIINARKHTFLLHKFCNDTVRLRSVNRKLDAPSICFEYAITPQSIFRWGIKKKNVWSLMRVYGRYFMKMLRARLLNV